jgi:hypothetical protein
MPKVSIIISLRDNRGQNNRTSNVSNYNRGQNLSCFKLFWQHNSTRVARHQTPQSVEEKIFDNTNRGIFHYQHPFDDDPTEDW